jgi:hypothetical protein
MREPLLRILGEIGTLLMQITAFLATITSLMATYSGNSLSLMVVSSYCLLFALGLTLKLATMFWSTIGTAWTFLGHFSIVPLDFACTLVADLLQKLDCYLVVILAWIIVILAWIRQTREHILNKRMRE